MERSLQARWAHTGTGGKPLRLRAIRPRSETRSRVPVSSFPLRGWEKKQRQENSGGADTLKDIGKSRGEGGGSNLLKSRGKLRYSVYLHSNQKNEGEWFYRGISQRTTERLLAIDSAANEEIGVSWNGERISVGCRIGGWRGTYAEKEGRKK